MEEVSTKQADPFMNGNALAKTVEINSKSLLMLTGDSVNIQGLLQNSDTKSESMEPRATGSRLEQLLTEGRRPARSNSSEVVGTPVASVGAKSDSLGKSGDEASVLSTEQTSSPDAEKYRNPRKRLLNNINAADAEQRGKDQSEKAKKMPKTTTSQEISSAGKDQMELQRDKQDINDGLGAKSVKPNLVDYEFIGAQIDKLLQMPSPPPKSRWKTSESERKSKANSQSNVNDVKSQSPDSKKKGKAESAPSPTEPVSVSRKKSTSQESQSTKSTSKSFECTCGLSFPSKAALLRHEKSEHPKSGITISSDLPVMEHAPTNDPGIDGDFKNADGSIPEISADPPKLSLEVSSSSPASVQTAFSIISTDILTKNKTEGMEDSRRSLAQNIQKLSSAMPKRPNRKGKKAKNDKVNTIPKKLEEKKSSPRKRSNEGEEMKAPKNPIPSPIPAPSGRASLRRNIQKPKWLSDADLVTDYEVPRTNAMRSSAPSGITNGSRSSVESKKQTAAASKSEKNKPRSSTEKKEKEEKESTGLPKIKQLIKEEKEESVEKPTNSVTEDSAAHSETLTSILASPLTDDNQPAGSSETQNLSNGQSPAKPDDDNANLSSLPAVKTVQDASSLIALDPPPPTAEVEQSQSEEISFPKEIVGEILPQSALSEEVAQDVPPLEEEKCPEESSGIPIEESTKISSGEQNNQQKVDLGVEQTERDLLKNVMARESLKEPSKSPLPTLTEVNEYLQFMGAVSEPIVGKSDGDKDKEQGRKRVLETTSETSSVQTKVAKLDKKASNKPPRKRKVADTKKSPRKQTPAKATKAKSKVVQDQGVPGTSGSKKGKGKKKAVKEVFPEPPRPKTPESTPQSKREFIELLESVMAIQIPTPTTPPPTQPTEMQAIPGPSSVLSMREQDSVSLSNSSVSAVKSSSGMSFGSQIETGVDSLPLFQWSSFGSVPQPTATLSSMSVDSNSGFTIGPFTTVEGSSFADISSGKVSAENVTLPKIPCRNGEISVINEEMDTGTQKTDSQPSNTQEVTVQLASFTISIPEETITEPDFTSEEIPKKIVENEEEARIDTRTSLPLELASRELSRVNSVEENEDNVTPDLNQDGDDEAFGLPSSGDEDLRRGRRDRSDSLSMRSCGSGSQSEKIKALDDSTSVPIPVTKEKDRNAPCSSRTKIDNDLLVDSDSDSNDSLMSEFSELAAQVSEKTDGVKLKEDCLRFITTKVSSKSMWAIRKELKRLKTDKNYFKFGKLTPLAAGLMHDIFCQSLR